MPTRVLHTVGHAPYVGALPGTYSSWSAGSTRTIPSESARLLAERYPGRFVPMDRAMRPPNAGSVVPPGVAGRHWKTLRAEVSRGEHDAYLGPLSEAPVSEAVKRAIAERSAVLRGG